jgi:hypothetical protein
VVLAWAAVYCVLWLVAGAMGGVKMVWFTGGHGRGPVVSLLFFQVSRPVFGQGRQGVDKESPGHCLEVRD